MFAAMWLLRCFGCCLFLNALLCGCYGVLSVVCFQACCRVVARLIRKYVIVIGIVFCAASGAEMTHVSLKMRFLVVRYSLEFVCLFAVTPD